VYSRGSAHGFPEQDQKRRALSDFATLDPASGGLKPEFVPESTTGGPGDKLHPNRAGYLAMGNAIDLDTVVGKGKELRPTAQKK